MLDAQAGAGGLAGSRELVGGENITWCSASDVLSTPHPSQLTLVVNPVGDKEVFTWLNPRGRLGRNISLLARRQALILDVVGVHLWCAREKAVGEKCKTWGKGGL